MDSLFDRKRTLRRQVLARRDALTPAAHREASRKIAAAILALADFAAARSVLAYLSIGSELQTSEIVGTVLTSGKTLVLPRVDRDRKVLTLHRVERLSSTLLPGIWGIQEPDPVHCPSVPPSAVDFVLVPGVAFSPRCERLGYGGGYYDRLLAQLPSGVPLVAGAFALQIVAEIPMAASDRCIDRVITEGGEYLR